MSNLDSDLAQAFSTIKSELGGRREREKKELVGLLMRTTLLAKRRLGDISTAASQRTDKI